MLDGIDSPIAEAQRCAVSCAPAVEASHRGPLKTMRPWARVLAVPAFFAWLVAALLRAQAWWRGELAAPGVLDVVLIASLPLLAWVYFRHLSVFGKGKGQCLLPADERTGPPGGQKSR